MEPIKAVEKVLEYMNTLGLSQSESVVISEYVAQTLKYNSIKDAIADDIKTEILKEIKKLKKIGEKNGRGR